MLEDFPRNETAEEFDGMVRGIALPVGRTPQQKGDFQLPAGTRVVSADNHWSITDDLFFERFPAHLKDRAPRLFTDKDGVHNWYMDGKSMIPPAFHRAASSFDCMPGSFQIAPRMRHLDVEGIEKEIVFGNTIGSFYAWPDLEVREWIFRIYNQHLSEMHAQAPGRFYGVGLINYWDMDRVRESIAELQALGLKTFLLPIFPKAEDGRPLNYTLPEMTPLWTAIEDSGMPVCFHVGEFYQDGPGGLATSGMVNFGPFRKNLGELIFGGVFDRHPKLQVVFMEAQINWVPGALQTASSMYECNPGLLDPQIAHHPRYYWHKHCYTTFMHDPAGMRLLDIVGSDRVMWCSDYPHQESTYGYSWSAMKAVVDAVSANEARAILGGTALKVFKL